MRFRITDDNGEEFVVEEMQDEDIIEEKEEVQDEDVIEETAEEVHDEETFTEEEIAKLKGLLAVADKLMGLVSTEDSDEEEIDETIEDEDEEVEVDETVADEDEIEEEEEVVDTAPISDSFGSMEKKSKKAKDSVDHQVEISNAWANNYAKFNRNK